MVQSSDLARISTVQSTDFTGQSSDLIEDLYKSSSRSEDFIYFVWILVCQSIEDAFYTTSLLTDWDFQMVFLRSPLRTHYRSEHRLDLDASLPVLDLFLNFLLYSSSSLHSPHLSWNPPPFWGEMHGFLEFPEFPGKSSDFLVNFLDIPW